MVKTRPDPYITQFFATHRKVNIEEEGYNRIQNQCVSYNKQAEKKKKKKTCPKFRKEEKSNCFGLTQHPKKMHRKKERLRLTSS